MISLLLTLFISLFSVCPTINQVDQAENNIVNICEEGPVKSANRFDYNDIEYLTMSLGDFGNGYYVHGMVKKICEYANRTSSFENGLQDLSDNANGPVYLYYSNIHNLTLKVMSLNTCYITDMYFKISDSDLGNTKLLETYLSIDPNSSGYLRIWSYFNPLSFVNNTSFDNTGSILTNYEPYTYCNVSYTPLTSDPVTKSYITCSWSYTSVGSSVQPSPVFDILNNYDYYINDLEDTAFTNGYNQGYTQGEIVGKAEGIEEGYESGYQAGFQAGEETQDAYDDGFNAGRQTGYAEGLADAEVDSTIFTIFSGILDVGLLPVNVFLAILNFEVFGINISGFVSALLTVSIAIIVIRFIFGGKKND